MNPCSGFLLGLSASAIALALQLPSTPPAEQNGIGLEYDANIVTVRTQQGNQDQADITQRMVSLWSKSAPPIADYSPFSLVQERSLFKNIKEKDEKKEKDDKKTDATTTRTKTSTSTSSPSTTSKTTSQSRNVAVGTAKPSPTTTNPPQSTNGAYKSSRASSASQSSSSCQATGRASKSTGYTVTTEPKNYKPCLSTIEKHISKPENKCTNDIVFRDDAGSDSQYFLGMFDTKTVALVRKTKTCKDIAEVKESKDTAPPQAKGNSTLTDMLQDAKAHQDDADVKTREAWMSRLFRRVPLKGKARDSWALLRLSVGQVTRLNLARSPRQYVLPESGGSGVEIYVVDDSVSSAPHPQLKGRVKDYLKSDYVRAPKVAVEERALRVAGCAAGKTVGVAHKANIISVKMTPPDRTLRKEYAQIHGHDEGQKLLRTLSIISALKKARQRYETARKPGVLTLSRSVPYKDSSVEIEIRRIITAGMMVVHAAGDQDLDACLPEADNGLVRDLGHLTIGATDVDDEVAGFSNWGDCVDLYAPGDEVTVPDQPEDEDVELDDGTFLSAGYVAGVIALMLGEEPHLTPASIRSRLLTKAGRARDRDRGVTVPLIQMTDLF